MPHDVVSLFAPFLNFGYLKKINAHRYFAFSNYFFILNICIRIYRVGLHIQLVLFTLSSKSYIYSLLFYSLV